MYQNTKLFRATITAVAILSTFHSCVSLGNSGLKVLEESSAKLPKFYVKGFSSSSYERLPITIFPAKLSENKIETDLEPLKTPLKSNELSYEWQISSNTKLKPGSYEAMFCVSTQNDPFPCHSSLEKTSTSNYYTTGFKYVPNTDVATNEEAGANIIDNAEAIGSQPDVSKQNQNACDDKPPRKVTMSGKIVDAETKQGIFDAKLVILVRDTLIYEYDAFLDSSSIFSQIFTDTLGNYKLPRKLRNDRKYSMFVMTTGYKRYKLDEQLIKSCSNHFIKDFSMEKLKTDIKN